MGLITNDRDLHVHVAYRLGNRVVYTKGLKLIPKGEILLTDFHGHLARARCGNVLKVFVPPALVPPAPFVEPDLDTFAPDISVDIPDYQPDLPESPAAPVPAVVMPNSPEDWGDTYPITPISFIPGGFIPFSPTPCPPQGPPPTAVPEPNSGLLILAFIALIAVCWAISSSFEERRQIYRVLDLHPREEEKDKDHVANTEVR
jgi:hypothetical protein